MVVETRFFLARSRRLAAPLVVLLVVGCGRSERHVGDDDAVPTSGAGGDSGTGGSGGAGGTSGGGTGGTLGGTAGKGTGGDAGGGSPSGGSAGTAVGGGAGTAVGGSAGDAECTKLSEAYEVAFQQTLQCDPDVDMPQCTQRITYGLGCGEDVFINPVQIYAIEAMQSAAQGYADRSCGPGNILCGASDNALGGNCTPNGHCVTVYENGGRGCKVNGVIYSHGESGIPALDGCNTCSCDDGKLGCTEKACADPPCPVPQVPGTQCAQCGPTDDCRLIEYGCFSECVSSKDCDPPAGCVSSVCVTGICG